LPHEIVESEQDTPQIGGYTYRRSRSIVMLFAPLDAHEVRQERLRSSRSRCRWLIQALTVELKAPITELRLADSVGIVAGLSNRLIPLSLVMRADANWRLTARDFFDGPHSLTSGDKLLRCQVPERAVWSARIVVDAQASSMKAFSTGLPGR
jgi:hypothetical protein